MLVIIMSLQRGVHTAWLVKPWSVLSLLQRHLRNIGSAILGFVVFISVGCGKSSLCSSQEIARRPSPDKVVDAVIVKTNCGATADYTFSVFVTPTDKEPTGKEVFLADKVEDLEVVWVSPKNLLVTYAKARIFSFKNFWEAEEVDNFQYVISIAERKHIEDKN